MNLKHAIAALLAALTCGAAAAQSTVATAKTDGGGLIRLMDHRGICGDGWLTFVNVDTSTSQASTGCWKLDKGGAGQVIAIYNDTGKIYFYGLEHFTMTERPKPAARSSGKNL